MRVVVTGSGALTSLGLDVPTWFNALKKGETGVRYFPEWEQYRGLNSFLGATVPAYDISRLPRQVRRSMSRMSEMAMLATLQALQEAGLNPGADINTPRTLLILGSTSGSPDTMENYFRKLFEKNGPEGQVSTSFFKIMNHSVAANVGAGLDYRGALLSPSSACATSAQAVILGWELLRAGLYDRVIAGGADELHYMTAAIFDIVQAASRGFNNRPTESPRPFDSARDGLVVSEGAAVVVMESMDLAIKRGAKPLAEIRGGAYFCDGTHMSQSSQSAMTQVMRASLERAGLKESEIDYVNAHATGTIHGDLEEARALYEVFGDRVPVSSLKAHFGHTLAACGTLELIASMKMLDEQILIPTRNLREPAPDCAMLQHVKENRPYALKHVLSNNFAFGGMNTSLLVSKI